MNADVEIDQVQPAQVMLQQAAVATWTACHMHNKTGPHAGEYALMFTCRASEGGRASAAAPGGRKARDGAYSC